MSATTKIQWCDHTFNPWRGCTKVSAGCAHCYAEVYSKRNSRVFGIWGDKGTRPVASETYWREPFVWNRSTERNDERHRVFCASLADVCEDRPDLTGPRLRLKQTIYDTPQLDWLLLTKRPENYLRLFWGPNQGEWPTNVWAGTSCEDQKTADERIPHLLRCPASVRFLSLEPLLGPIDFRRRCSESCTGECGWASPFELLGTGFGEHFALIDWVIVGGESGPHARPFDIAWPRSIRDQCKAAGVAYFLKQCGARPYECGGHRTIGGRDTDDCGGESAACRIVLRDSHGGDPSEWPADLRVREFPRCAL